MFLTPFCVRPFFRSFEQHEASCLNFFILFVHFMPFSFFCCSIVTFPWEVYLSSFHLWSHIRVTLLLVLFLCSFIFMF
jgi:hypothetical protein